MPLNLTVTSKGKALLIHEGFTFIFERDGSENKEIWRCSEYTKDKC